MASSSVYDYSVHDNSVHEDSVHEEREDYSSDSRSLAHDSTYPAHQTDEGNIASLVLKVQLGVLSCAFVIAFMIGALAPSKGHITASMALPEWNDRVQPWDREVHSFAARMATVFGVSDAVALEFSPWILEAALRQQLAPELLAGLVLTESSFRKNVTSAVGAIGPAQVRPEFWSQFCGTKRLDDPAENIYCGAQILAHYVERCGAEACALSAYNVGPYSKKQRAAGERYVAKVGQWRDRLAMHSDSGKEPQHHSSPLPVRDFGRYTPAGLGSGL